MFDWKSSTRIALPGIDPLRVAVKDTEAGICSSFCPNLGGDGIVDSGRWRSILCVRDGVLNFSRRSWTAYFLPVETVSGCGGSKESQLLYYVASTPPMLHIVGCEAYVPCLLPQNPAPAFSLIRLSHPPTPVSTYQPQACLNPRAPGLVLALVAAFRRHCRKVDEIKPIQ